MRTKRKNISEKLCDTEIPWKQWKRFEGGLDEGITYYTYYTYSLYIIL